MSKLVALLVTLLGTPLLASAVDKATLDHIKPLIIKSAETNFGGKFFIDTIELNDGPATYKRHTRDTSKLTEYFVWCCTADEKIGKYIAIFQADTLFFIHDAAEANHTNNQRLKYMYDNWVSYQKTIKVYNHSKDSIVKFIDSTEELRFKKEKPSVLAIIKKHIERKAFHYQIDSIALTDYDYDETSPNYWNNITQREYTVWAIVNNAFAGKVITYISKGKVDSFKVDFANKESDPWITRKDEILNEKRKAIEEKRLKTNKAAITAKITTCLKEYANDPSSVKVAEVYLYDVYPDNTVSYGVAYRGKNGFGALILSSTYVEFDEKGKCQGIKNKKLEYINSEGETVREDD